MNQSGREQQIYGAAHMQTHSKQCQKAHSHAYLQGVCMNPPLTIGHKLYNTLSFRKHCGPQYLHMVRKANYVLATFPFVGLHIPTRLFQSYCLSLYGSCLWSPSCPALLGIEVAFNIILHKL